MTEDDTERCETEGCHRKTSLVMTYAVWMGDVEYRERRVCRPCSNAMRFRETFDLGDDSWYVEPATNQPEGPE